MSENHESSAPRSDGNSDRKDPQRNRLLRGRDAALAFLAEKKAQIRLRRQGDKQEDVSFPSESRGGEQQEREKRLLADRDYIDGETPAAAVGALEGNPLDDQQARAFLGTNGLIGFHVIGELDPSLPRQLLLKYGPRVLKEVGIKVRYTKDPVDIPQLVANHEREPTETNTAFFREASMLVFSENVAGSYQQEVGRPLRIAEVGCSNGEETWSLAASLRGNGVDAHIDGFDISEKMLEEARNGGPYMGQLAGLRLDLHVDQGYPHREAYLSFFHDRGGPRNMVPTDELRSMADFNPINIIDQQLEPGYDAALAYNTLWQYPPATREQMLRNILHGLRPGGTFMFEGTTGGRRSDISKEFRKWANDLSRFGLTPHPSIGEGNEKFANSVLIYNPPQGESLPTDS